MKTPKPLKPKEAHVSNTGVPSGDYYGVAIKNKVGRMRDDYMGMTPGKPKSIGKPPKSLA
jgi:hypothetical protein